jgi:DNA-binding MarR family transcriptional regulator
MKHSIHVNQKQALDLGMTNINQAHIFDLLTGVSTWAKPEVINEEVYYWVSRQRICTELPLLDMKPDTVYRHLKKLSDCGLIEYLKHGKKDCIRLTEKGRSYYVGNKSESEQSAMSDSNPDGYVGNESELEQNSETNPSELGNESEKNSDLNPTDQTTNNILQPEDQKEEKKPRAKFTAPTEQEVEDFAIENRLNLNGFFDYYESNGWMVGKNKMKKWQAAARNWDKRQAEFNRKSNKSSSRRPGEFPSENYINGEVL